MTNEQIREKHGITWLPERRRYCNRTKAQLLKIIGAPDKHFGGHDPEWITIKHQGDIFVAKVLELEPLVLQSGTNNTLVVD